MPFERETRDFVDDRAKGAINAARPTVKAISIKISQGAKPGLGELRRFSGGKPVGFKLCIGSRREFLAICKAMIELDSYP